MDGCVSDFGIKSLIARDRKKELQKAAEEFAKTEDHAKPFAGIEFRSSRVFPRRFDTKSLPKIDPVKANPLPWAALEETEVGKKFAVKFYPYVDELDGKTVSISGFMQPSKRDEVSEFAFTEFPVGCWFCESPSPFQIVEVETKEGKLVPFRRELVTVTGKLVLNRTEPERLLFRIAEATVKLAE